MIVGACVVELHVHDCQSLKAKRGVVRSIVRRLRNRYNLSVAEVGGQDTWQRAVLGLCASGSDALRVRQLLEQASDFIEDMHLAEVCAVDFQVLHLPLEEPWGEEGEQDGGDPFADPDDGEAREEGG